MLKKRGLEKFCGERVAVIGSGMTGLETAVLLAEWGNCVTVVEMAAAIARGMWMQHIDDIKPKLENYKVAVLLNHKLVKIEERRVVLESKIERKALQADKVVLAVGVRPDHALYAELKDEFARVFLVGDAGKSGRIANAIRSAAAIAMRI